jgi:hypothetical protein
MLIAALILFTATAAPAVHFKQWDRCEGPHFASRYKIDDSVGAGANISPIVYIRKVLDKSGALVGWVYTAKSGARWIAAEPAMSPADLSALHVRRPTAMRSAPAVPLRALPARLRIVECAQSEVHNSPPS